MYSVERKALIMSLLEKENVVSVVQLANELKISKETARRDLRELERDGMLHRTHGGAVYEPQTSSISESPFNVREICHYPEKVAICKTAAEFVKDGDTIYVDNSSTTLNLLKYINPQYQITIITNSIRFLLESVSYRNANRTLISLGGIFREKNYSLAGILSLDNARSFRPNKAFISCRAIEANVLSDGSLYEIEVKRAFIATSKETFVLADHSKFKETGPFYLTDLSKVSHIITDDKIDEESVRTLEQSGLSVTVAPAL